MRTLILKETTQKIKRKRRMWKKAKRME